MGDIWTDQPLGVEGNLTKVDFSWSADELTLEYELTERRYLRSTQVGITTEQEICAISIEGNAGGLGGSGDITDVSATYTEQSTDPNYIPLYPGEDVETGKRLMYVGTDCFIFTGVERQYSISGNGRPPIPESALNDYLSNYVTKPFAPAHGTFDIAIHDLAQISNLTLSKPDDGVWTWGCEAMYVEPTDSPGNSHLLSPPDEVAVLVPDDVIGPYTNTLTMSKGKNSKATSGWSLTLYPTA